MEGRLLQEDDPTYPVFITKVPDLQQFGFVTTGSADVIFVRFDDNFRMFHMHVLHPSIVRLLALSLAHQLCIEDTPGIAIMDPFYMQDIFLHNTKGKVKVTRYIQNFMLADMFNRIIFMPHFPEQVIR